MSAESMLTCGRPFPVSSILTATTALPDGLSPVSGLIAGAGGWVGDGAADDDDAVDDVGVGVGVVFEEWCPLQADATSASDIVTLARASVRAGLIIRFPLPFRRAGSQRRPGVCRRRRRTAADSSGRRVATAAACAATATYACRGRRRCR